VKRGVPDVVVLGTGVVRLDGVWALKLKEGLDWRCSPKVIVVDDGVSTGGLEAELVDALGDRPDIVWLAEGGLSSGFRIYYRSLVQSNGC